MIENRPPFPLNYEQNASILKICDDVPSVHHLAGFNL